MDFFAFDSQQRCESAELIAGVDEAGRGPIAGPLFAAAVVLDSSVFIPGLNDSKKLSFAAREKLYDRIIVSVSDYAIACVDPSLVDELNVFKATYLAMYLALKHLSVRYCIVLIDGPGYCWNYHVGSPVRFVIRGDEKSASVACASILAKVSRDRAMKEACAAYPAYGFSSHKGYATSQHLRALRQYGPCPIHRASFAPVRLCSEKQ